MPDDLEREIEDILNRLDKFLPEESAAQRLRKRVSNAFYRFQRNVAHLLSRISLGHLMIVSLLLVLFAFAFRWSVMGRYALIAGLILLFSTIAISFFTSRRAGPEKRWRGQPIDLSGPSLADRIKDWLRARRNQNRQ
ncbi:MAG: hypothetical protein QME71_04935 [Dehalococcoidia bacterium]|nr:hypothetical protein [Dehalococcoidia bacterium]